MSQLSSPETVHSVSLSASNRQLLDWLSLSFFPRFGCTIIHRLVREFGSPHQVLNARPEQLVRVEGVGLKMAQMLTDSRQVAGARKKAALEIENNTSRHGTIICPADDLYPRALQEIADPPVALYCRGERECLIKPAVAVVGSRAATTYGKRVSFELARELARQGVIVVSGMAMGIDGEAHAGALAGKGQTIGVLGCGVDMVYPHQHAELFRNVAANGLLVSEYPLGTPPDGFRFPERNRIISGISLGTVVVEASVKSGSLITARMALDQGREVFAVPGRIDSPRSRGTHLLIQQGAKLVNSVDDIMDELDIAGLLQPGGVADSSCAQPQELSGEEKHLLSCLEVYPVTIDELVRKSCYAPADIFQMLLRLELWGMVRQLPGQQYELCR